MQHQPAYRLLRPVFLVGFMGAGKSTVAQLLCQNHGLPWADLDAQVEQDAGLSIPQVFEQRGEAAFRDLESSALRQLAEGPGRVVSCGGGVVVRPENVQAMHEAGFVVYLQVDARRAAERIADLSGRPLFGGPREADALLRQRALLYEQAADAAVDTNGLAPEQVADKVMSILGEAGLLVSPEG